MHIHKFNNKKSNIITKKIMSATKINNKIYKFIIYKKAIFNLVYL